MESQVTHKLTDIPGMMRGQAGPWFIALAASVKADQTLFELAFLKEFRLVGVDTTSLLKVGQL